MNRRDMDRPNLSTATWRKPSYSGGTNNSEYVEASLNTPGVVPVRDSKDPNGPWLAFEAGEWSAFVFGLKSGEFLTH
ncbi:DUF397 domain-containing protein [Kitasatospora purpeofusca]|uniref:DUF397 domain-containing protein n=1 Tax=Kitasatospora purpeofusca TaxID=67352 RepID=UPI0036E110D1